MKTYRCLVRREERLFEFAHVSVEASSLDAAENKLAAHFAENGNEDDLEGDPIDWEFAEQQTVLTSIEMVTEVK